MLTTHLLPGYACDPSPAPITYGAEYYARYQAYAGTPMERRLNELRVALVKRRLKHYPPRYRRGQPMIIDVGIGNGSFIQACHLAGIDARGYDVNPYAIAWLLDRGLFAEPYQMAREVEGLTLWDTLEHLPRPAMIAEALAEGQRLFVSLPIAPDHLFHCCGHARASQTCWRDWKHYRPREHLHYWSRSGFAAWCESMGLTELEANDLETEAGREDIWSFALVK